MSEQRWPAPAVAAAGLVFILLATASSGGYRFGVSDQAFSVPSVIHALTPGAFPRDSAMIDTQARFMLFDDGVAAIMRVTGLSIETLYLTGYLFSTALLWVALVLLTRTFALSRWLLILLGAVVALRHRIPHTTVNSFEPYFYPRTLAFAFGVVAVAAFLYRRQWLAVALTIAAALAHVTTGLWFIVLVGVAWASLDTRVRGVAAVLVLAGAGLLAWSAISGRLTPLIAPMDGAWLAVMVDNDSLFPSQWPLWVWVANLALPAALVAIHRARARRGSSRIEDEALVWGAFALLLIFLITLPMVTWHWTFPTQLQISRVFWLIDFLVALYGTALIAEVTSERSSPMSVRAIALTVLSLVTLRAAFVMGHERAERSLFQIGLPASDWTDAMHWLERQPLGVHVLADPGHVLLYGSSVRVAAHRDVVLENVKDTAVALYSRDVAMRVRERRASIGDDFAHLTMDRADQLARQYGIDYLVTAGDPLALQVAYQNATFRIYDMKGRALP